MRKLVCLLLLLSTVALAIEKQPLSDYKKRREVLAQRVAAAGNGIVLLFAPLDSEVLDSRSGFHQEDNFFYLTGWEEPGAALLIAPATKERAYTEIFFLPVRNALIEGWHGEKLGPENARAKEITGFDRVESYDRLREIIFEMTAKPRGLVLTDTSSNSSGNGPISFLRRANAFPYYIAMEDVRPHIAELRVIKDKNEQALVRKSVEAGIDAHFAAMRAVKPGMTERELHALMQFEFSRRGCERPGYSPIVAAGKNSTVLHYSESAGKLNDGDVVKLDVGPECSGYVTDITRTLPVNGKFTARQREIYNVVLGALEAAVKAYTPGKSTIGRFHADSLHKVAFDYIESKGYGKYFPHGLSHFVGLAVHDVGNTNQVLRPGMVFTIEPGVYIPEEKIGVRIEDMFLIGEKGELINLTERLPRRAEEVEAVMAGGRKSGN